VYLMAKASIGYFIVMWVRSTLPRIRIDHMLDLNWKVLTPISLALLIATAVLDKVFAETALRAPALLAGNVAVLLLSWALLRGMSRKARRERQVFKKRPEARAVQP
jgi:NADH-quinone oxidoreductase subunit H